MTRLTPAQRHQQRIRAAQAADAPETARSMEGATTYELQLMQLKQDQLRLRQLQSIDARNQLKPQLLPEYDAYLDGILAAGHGQQDEVVATLMLWHLDVANYPRGLQLADYVLRHGMKMPDRFERTPATLIAEEVANTALTALKAGEPFALAVLEETHQLTQQHDMPDEVRAKLLFALGLALRPAEDSAPELLAIASANLTEAIRLHERVGAKKDLERIERWLKKHAESKPDPAPEPTSEAEQDEPANPPDQGEADS